MSYGSESMLTLRGRTASRSGAIAGLALVALVAVALALLGSSALHFAPALALAVPLLRRRYPGEALIARLSAARAPRRVRPRRSVPRPRPLAARLLPRGGELIGSALAVRPPPAGALPS